ncbi:MAG: DoxX family protein [Pseudomonadales bacterium]|nr:DoxX family protein [Pseudomonadales bacterium]
MKTNFYSFSELVSRVFLSALFLMGGLGKIAGYAGTQAYMDSMGVPGALLPLVIALEVGGGIAIVAGLFTRWVAFVLGGFSVISALVFHSNFGDQTQSIMFMKNVAIAGGFGLLFVNGAGAWSLDALLARRKL